MDLLMFGKICVTLGLMKGATAKLEHIYFSPAEDISAHDNCQNPIFLTHLPKGLLLRAPGVHWVLPTERLPPLREDVDRRGLFLLNYTTSTFDFTESSSQEVLPGIRKQVKQTHRVRRTQFMAVPAVVRTVHISQGEEWPAVVADCAPPPNMDPATQWLATYVMISRAMTLDGLLLLRLPPRSFFSLGAPAHIVEELERLHKVEVASQERLAAYVRSLPKSVHVPKCVWEALATPPPPVNIKKYEETPAAPAAATGSGGVAASASAKSTPHIAATLRIQEKYLSAIESGEKTVEARINQGRACQFKAGDRVCLTTGDRLRVAEIMRVRRFLTFRDMLKACGLRRCLPKCRSIDVGVELYHDFSNYETLVKVHGVVAIDLEVRDDVSEAPALGSPPSAKAVGHVAASSSSSPPAAGSAQIAASVPIIPSSSSAQAAATAARGNTKSDAPLAGSSSITSPKGIGVAPPLKSVRMASFSTSYSTGTAGASSSSTQPPASGIGREPRCERCDDVGHSAEHCTRSRQARVAHAVPATYPLLFETQRELRCGKHALNNVFGGELTFTDADLSEACATLVRESLVPDDNGVVSDAQVRGDHEGRHGWYSLAAMNMALRRTFQYELQLGRQLRFDVNALEESGVVGAIANTNDGSHWVALKRVHGTTWLLDSLRQPAVLDTASFHAFVNDNPHTYAIRTLSG